ncbi:VanZ family protein [Polaribacter sp.]|uniref:VanZ family protein n=1 Tax=Polaribacter sp. TaxID=1920175 RepID=UPI004047447A
MLRRIKNLLKDSLLLIAIAITIGLLGLSLIKMPEGGFFEINNIDKAYHGFAYFSLTIIWLLTFHKTPQKKYLIFICCIIFGIIIEVLQTILTNYRTGDIMDIISNSLGCLVALFVFSLIFKKK